MALANVIEIPVVGVDDSMTPLDTVVILGLNVDSKHCTNFLSKYEKIVARQIEYDKSAEKGPSVIVAPENSSLPVPRIVYAGIGPVNRDYDDVRRFYDAARDAIKRALKAGGRKLLLALPTIPNGSPAAKYSDYDLASFLGAYESIYMPVECRELNPDKIRKVDLLALANFLSDSRAEHVKRIAFAIESGRTLARDIAGSDPERMSAPRVAEYVKDIFTGSECVKVEIIDKREEIEKEFPCLGAVNRGSLERHSARVILLTYQFNADEPVKETVALVGKGVTYDTGGHDIKAGGIMAGMHRDKGGAAAVAGFFYTLGLLKPKGLKVIGAMAMVRNSIGPDAYVSDELIKTRSGARIRVGNTDAEGRMAMVDPLCFLKEKIVKEKLPNPVLHTVATLTGHACIAVGQGYSIVAENGPAKGQQVAAKLQEAGDRVGDPFEISTIRREDYDFNVGKSEYEDYLQCNNLPSTRTPRGHQFPAAFLIQVSGLDKHGQDSDKPLPYAHIDIAAADGPFPGIPSGAPIPALTLRYALPYVV